MSGGGVWGVERSLSYNWQVMPRQGWLFEIVSTLLKLRGKLRPSIGRNFFSGKVSPWHLGNQPSDNHHQISETQGYTV